MSLLKRPVEHLYPLEVQCVTSPQERKGLNPTALDQQTVHIDTVTSSRPKRVASDSTVEDQGIKELNS